MRSIYVHLTQRASGPRNASHLFRGHRQEGPLRNRAWAGFNNRSRSLCRAERTGPSKADAASETAVDSGGPQGMQLAATTTAVAAAALLQPGAALAATHTGANWHDWYLLSVGVGATCTFLTIWATTRFLLSFFPELERKAHSRCPPWVFLTACDPVLRPLQRDLFKMEPGDLNYGAVVLLALTVSVLESLVGEGGLWLEKVPDLDLLHYMQYMVFFGHSLLLPSWVMVILRSFWVI